MREWILIAVGGSGARVAQSVVALAAAGFPAMLGQEDVRLTIRVVDLDIHHADGRELFEMIQSYNRAFGFLWQNGGIERKSWRPLQIVLEKNDPFFFQTGLDSGKTTITKITDFIPTIDKHSGSELLIKALYGHADRDMELLQGCKGRPKIGALLWEYLYRNYDKPFWSTLVTLASAQDETRIMFTGSLFGGTGASGVPTLAKLFGESLGKNEGQTWKIGMTLLAPYFYLQDDPGKKWWPGEVKAEFSSFPFQSKMALNYYLTSDILSGVDYVQVVGNSEQSMKQDNGKAGQREVVNSGDSESNPQNNPSVPTELAAAVGIFEFFAGAGGNTVVVPKKEEKSDWKAFPQADRVRAGLQQLERLCLMTDFYYKPLATRAKSLRPVAVNELWDEQNRSSAVWKDTWLSEEKGIGALIDFSKKLLRWFNDMDLNGLNSLNVTENKNLLKNKAKHGQTGHMDLAGTKLRSIAGSVNDRAVAYMRQRETLERRNPAAESFTLALLDACEDKKPPETALAKRTAANA